MFIALDWYAEGVSVTGWVFAVATPTIALAIEVSTELHGAPVHVIHAAVGVPGVWEVDGEVGRWVFDAVGMSVAINRLELMGVSLNSEWFVVWESTDQGHPWRRAMSRAEIAVNTVIHPPVFFL